MKYISKLLALFAIGMMATACSNDVNEVNRPLTVTAPTVTSVSGSSAIVTLTATGSHITHRGVCYSTSPNPTISDDKVYSTSKDMVLTIGGLAKSTTYYVRGFAQTSYDIVYSDEVSFTTSSSESTDDDPQTEGPSALKRVSVHDPSVVWDPTTSSYYIFGSHRAAAKCNNMMSWEAFTAPWATATSKDAANEDAFTTPQVTKVKKGGVEYDLNFNALAWSQRGSETYDIGGNMWAPDVIYNKKMGKWCMYLSINGDFWYSSIIMLTADNIVGPYRYQSPVVISGFRSGDSYKSTDLEIVLGEQASLPSRYAPSDNYGNHWPNCIDPCVFYDENGKLWMSYGSWSGGIFMLELDEETGLRDYDVTYAESETSDPYFGKKIAGGHYVSGEASYIEFIGGYYFLFMTYGGLDAAGGYQMRVFRSLNPDGPFVDSKGTSAVYDTYQLNFGPTENDGFRGVNIFGAYDEWGAQTVGAWGERAQGHNSIIAAQDGRTYLVYHTRFQDQGEGHQVRVHQVYQNEEGWLVAAPFEYTGEGIKSAGIAVAQKVATTDIPGAYKLLIHRYGLDHAAKEYAAPVDVTLNADGSISGGAVGTWSIKSGTSYITINIGSDYKGVMVPQTLEPTDTKAPCFTALDSKTGVTIWGYKAPLQ
ncbi:glycoside hydrolase family 43 protein [Prevotella sp. tf2-5]|uniref:glycoside hydrolase family 43 protein n=1 Tax=Prevotella sp. tf2-5 TaxID=1761889 RepID=UPI0008EF3A87|nr:glycoside hydrolase family 43 protein [Prevotella sp. tf2-5]SFP00409.1 arabinan endo-1,5-alpha-L-arabinosidase [Prevotella sp. tf2-5]